MKTATVALLLGLAVVLSGCASSAKRDTAADVSATAGMEVKSAFPLRELQVSLSDAAKAKLSENLKFDQNRLTDTLKRALEAKGILKSTAASLKGKIEVEVTDIRVRSSLSATLLGIFAGTDNVDGTVRIVSANGQVLDSIKVSASYGLGGLAGGQDEQVL